MTRGTVVLLILGGCATLQAGAPSWADPFSGWRAEGLEVVVRGDESAGVAGTDRLAARQMAGLLDLWLKPALLPLDEKLLDRAYREVARLATITDRWHDPGDGQFYARMRLSRADVEAQLAGTLMRHEAKDTVLSSLKDGLPAGTVVVPTDPIWLPAGWATIQRPVLAKAKADAGLPVVPAPREPPTEAKADAGLPVVSAPPEPPTEAKADAGLPVVPESPAKAPPKAEKEPQSTADAGPPEDNPPAAKPAAEEKS